MVEVTEQSGGTGMSGDALPSRPPWRGRAAFMAGALLVAVALIALDARAASPFGVTDVPLYQCYAQAFWQGRAAVTDPLVVRQCPWPASGPAPARYHALPREYPAAALAVFSLPLLTPWLPYDTAYRLWMAAFVLLGVAMLAWWATRWCTVAMMLYLFVGNADLALTRYDLVPALCVLGALLLAQRSRPRAAAVALAVGALLKVFPLLIMPLALLHSRRVEGCWRWDALALFGGIGTAGLAGAVAINPRDAWRPLLFNTARPLHLESVPGSLLWLLSPHGTVRVVSAYNSLSLVGGAQALWGAAFTLLGVAGLGATYLRQWRCQDTLAGGFLLVLLVTVVTSKVFSPQYLLWLLPIAAVADGVAVPWLIVAALAVPPFFTHPAVYMTLLLIRNTLLCVIALLSVFTPPASTPAYGSHPLGPQRTEGRAISSTASHRTHPDTTTL